MTWLYTMSGNDVTVPVAKTIGEIYDWGDIWKNLNPEHIICERQNE
jgi:hypothetical protein